MKKEDLYDVVAVLVFAISLAAALWLIQWSGGLSRFEQMSFLDLLIVGLASFRLTHLLTFDKIFAFARHMFMVRSDGEYLPAPRGVRRFIYQFFECIWCTGMWAGLFVVTIYLLGEWGRVIIYILAAAGVGSLLQLFSLAIATVGADD